MRAKFLQTLILAVAILSGVILLFESKHIFHKVNELKTSIEILDSKGTHLTSILIILPRFNFTPIQIDKFCDCRIAHFRHRNSTQEKICRPFNVEQQGAATLNGLPETLFFHIYEIPAERQQNEYLKLNCSHPDHNHIEITQWLLALDFQNILLMLRDSDNSNILYDFHQKYLLQHRYFLSQSGHYNNILINRKIYQKLEESVTFVNTKLDISSTRTATASKYTTEIWVSWEGNFYTHVKEVKRGSYLQIITFSATFLLAIERCIALYSKLSEKFANNK